MRTAEVFPEDFKRGTYTYRVRNFDMDGNVRSTDEVQLSLVAAKGEPGFGYGTLEISDTQEFNTNSMPSVKMKNRPFLQAFL